MRKPPIRIEIRTSKGVRVVQIPKSGVLALGSDERLADVVIKHEPGLEGRHVTLHAEDGSLIIEDAGTASGTFINGRRVRHGQLGVGETASAAGVAIRVLPSEVDHRDPPVAPRPPAVPGRREAASPLAEIESPAPSKRKPAAGTPAPRAELNSVDVRRAGNAGVEVSRWKASDDSCFRKSPGERIFAILDPARDKRIFKALLIHTDTNGCLYDGKSAQRFQNLAPHLVVFSPDSRLFEYLRREGWGRNWGSYFISSEPYADLRKHFRRFLKVELPGSLGGYAYFRFFDPRVFRSFVPASLPKQAADFFRAFRACVVEAADAEFAERYELTGESNRADGALRRR
jgi:hypothetical protein